MGKKVSPQQKNVMFFTRKVAWKITVGIICLLIAIFLLTTDIIGIVTFYRMRVTNGSAVHEFLAKPAEHIHISAYLFNITNAKQFLSGEDHKLKVQEVGPFTYRELRHNENLEIDEEAGVMRYEPRLENGLVPEESVADPDQVMVTMPNMALLGLATTMRSFPFWTRQGFNILASQLNSKPVVTVTANEYLWGYEDKLISLAHTLVPGFVDIEKLGIMDRLYAKEVRNRLELSIRDEDKFTIKTRNGFKKLQMGKGDPEECDECDEFSNAYEGIGYPAGVTPDTPVNLFRTGLCKILPMVYHKKVVNNGVEGLMFNLSDSFYSLHPNVTENRLLDLNKCFYGLPVVLSKVNFLGLDPKMYERIEGLKPNPKQECYVVVEPIAGLQTETYFAVQVNLKIDDLGFSSVVRSFSNMVLPILYIEIKQNPLPLETETALHKMYVIYPAIIMGSSIVLIILGISVIIYPFFKIILDRNRRIELNMTQKPLINEGVLVKLS